MKLDYFSNTAIEKSVVTILQALGDILSETTQKTIMCIYCDIDENGNIIVDENGIRELELLMPDYKIVRKENE